MKYKGNEETIRIPQEKATQAKLDRINKKILKKKKWELEGKEYHFKINNTLIESNDANALQIALCNNPPTLIIHIIEVLLH